MIRNTSRLVLIGLILSVSAGAANALPSSVTPLAQPTGVTIVKSFIQPSSILFQKIFKAPPPLIVIRKPIAQKQLILHSTRITGTGNGSGTGGTGTGGGGSVANVSAVVSPYAMQVTNAFGSDDVVTLTADTVYAVQPGALIFANDPSLNLSSTNFDNNGPFVAVGICAGDMGSQAMLDLDFTVQTEQSVNTNYLLQAGNFATGSVETLTASTNPNDYYISSAQQLPQDQPTQDVYALVQGNYSVVALQCPVGCTFYSCEVTPIGQ